jgi:uncharacterized RDD family membrane protein YckC
VAGFLVGIVAASLVFGLAWWSERQRANDLAAKISAFEKALKDLEAAAAKEQRR